MEDTMQEDDMRQPVPEDMQDYLQRMGAVLAEMESQHKQSNAPRRESLARATALYYERKHRSAPGDTSASGSAASSAVSSGASSPAALVRALSSPGGTRRSNNAGGTTPPQRRLEHSASSPATGRHSAAGSPRVAAADQPRAMAGAVAEHEQDAPGYTEQVPASQVTRRTLTWVSPSKQQQQPQKGRPPLHHQPPASSPARVRHAAGASAGRPGASPLRVSSSGSLHGTPAATSPRRSSGRSSRSGEGVRATSGVVSEADPATAEVETVPQQQEPEASAADKGALVDAGGNGAERQDSANKSADAGVKVQECAEAAAPEPEDPCEQRQLADQAPDLIAVQQQLEPPSLHQQEEEKEVPPGPEQRLRAREAYVNAEVSVLTDALPDDAASEFLMQGTILDEEGPSELCSDAGDGSSDTGSDGKADCLPRVGSPEVEEEDGSVAGVIATEAEAAPEPAAAAVVESARQLSPRVSVPQSPGQPGEFLSQDQSLDAAIAEGWAPSVPHLGPLEVAEVSASPRLSRRTSMAARASADEDLPLTQLSQVLKLRRSGSGAMPLGSSSGRASPWRASGGALSNGSPTPHASGPLPQVPSTSTIGPAAERTDSPEQLVANAAAAAPPAAAGDSPECHAAAVAGSGSPQQAPRPGTHAAAAPGAQQQGSLSPIPSCGDDTVLFGSPSGSPAASTASGLAAARRTLSAGRRAPLREATAGVLEQAAAAASAATAAATGGPAATAMGLALVGCSCEALPGVPSALDTPPGAAPAVAGTTAQQPWEGEDGSDGEFAEAAGLPHQAPAALPQPMWQLQGREPMEQGLPEEPQQQTDEAEVEVEDSEGAQLHAGSSDRQHWESPPVAELSAAATVSPSSSGAAVPADTCLQPQAAPWAAEPSACSGEHFFTAEASWSALAPCTAHPGSTVGEDIPTVEEEGEEDEETCSLDGLSETSSGSVGIEEELQLQRQLLEEQARIHAAGLPPAGMGLEEADEIPEESSANCGLVDSLLIESTIAVPTSLAPPHFLEAAAALGARPSANASQSSGGDDVLSAASHGLVATQSDAGHLLHSTGPWSPPGSAISTGAAAAAAAAAAASPTKAALSRMMRQLGSALSCASQPSVHYDWEFDEAAAAAAEAAAAAAASGTATLRSSGWSEADAVSAAMSGSVEGPSALRVVPPTQHGSQLVSEHGASEQQQVLQQTTGPGTTPRVDPSGQVMVGHEQPRLESPVLQQHRQQQQETVPLQSPVAVIEAPATTASSSSVGATARLICCALTGLALAAVEGAPPPHLIACGANFVLHAPTLLAVSAAIAATTTDSCSASGRCMTPPTLAELAAATSAAGTVIAAATGAALLIMPVDPTVAHVNSEVVETAADQIITDQDNGEDQELLDTEGTEQFSESPLPAESRLAPRGVTGVTSDLDLSAGPPLPSVSVIAPPGEHTDYITASSMGADRPDAGATNPGLAAAGEDSSTVSALLPPLLADVSRTSVLAAPTAADYDARRYMPGAELGTEGAAQEEVNAASAGAPKAAAPASACVDAAAARHESDLDSLTSLSEDLEDPEEDEWAAGGSVGTSGAAPVPAVAAWQSSAVSLPTNQMGSSQRMPVRPSPRELDSWLVVPAPPPPQRRQSQQQQLIRPEDQLEPSVERQPSQEHAQLAMGSSADEHVPAARQPSLPVPLETTAAATTDAHLHGTEADDSTGSPGSRGLFAALRALKHRHRGSGSSAAADATAPAATAALAAAGYGGSLGHGAAGDVQEAPAAVSRWDWRAPLGGSRRGSHSSGGEVPASATAQQQQQQQQQTSDQHQQQQQQGQQEMAPLEKQEQQPSGAPVADVPQQPAGASTSNHHTPPARETSGSGAAASAARSAALAKLKQDVLRRQQQMRASYQPLMPPPAPQFNGQQVEQQGLPDAAGEDIEEPSAEAPTPPAAGSRAGHGLRSGGLMAPGPRRQGQRSAVGLPASDEQEQSEPEAPTPPSQQQQGPASGAKPYLKRSTRTVVGGRVDWSQVPARTTSRLDDNYILPKSTASRRGGSSGSGGSYAARAAPAWRGGAGEAPAPSAAAPPPPRRREAGLEPGRSGARVGGGGAGLMGASSGSGGYSSSARYAVEYHGASPYGFRDVGSSSGGGSGAAAAPRGPTSRGAGAGRRVSAVDALNATDVSATRKSSYAVGGGAGVGGLAGSGSGGGYSSSPRKPASAPARGGAGGGGAGAFMYGGGLSSGGASTSGGGAGGRGITADSPLDDILSHVSSLLQDFDRTFGVHAGGES